MKKTFTSFNPLGIKWSRCLLLVFAIFLLSQNLHSQQTQSYTLKIRNRSVQQAVESMQSRYGISFVLNADNINLSRNVTIDLENRPLSEVINAIFRGQEVDIDIRGNRVTVDRKIVPRSATGQRSTTSITGRVVDNKGNAVVGAAVVDKETSHGVVTNADGSFSITLSDGRTSAVLSISFLGMETREINATRPDLGTIELEDDAQMIDDVVVVGYGVRQKATLTGSVASAKGSDITKNPSANITQSLAGHLPGVIINSRSGEPGNDNASILIRGRGTIGNSDPLYIIDGVERGGMGLVLLNPNDIETISVLKDSEAAIYGSRAANGVIVITTKRGKDGSPQINLSYNQSLSQPTRVPKLADSYLYSTVANELAVINHADPNTSPTLPYTAQEIEKYRLGNDPDYPNTDWYGFLIRNLTPMHRSNISVSGATDKMSYYLSLGELNQQGQYNEGSHKYKRYNFRSNVDVKLHDKVRVGMNLSGNHGQQHVPYTSVFELNSHTYLYSPTDQAYWPGTKLLQPLRDNENIMNWVTDNAGWRKTRIKTFEGTFFIKWELPWIKGFSLEGYGSHDTSQTSSKSFRTPTVVYFKDDNTGDYYPGKSGQSVDKPALTENISLWDKTTLSAKANYVRSFGGHNLDIIAGYEQIQYQSKVLQASRSDFASPALPELNVGTVDKEKQSNAGYSGKDARQSFYFRTNYDYKGKYLAQFTFRSDGSSKFPKSERFGYFPSASVGWRISEEAFMEGAEYVNNLKIRGSWGKSGNDNVSAFQYMMTYNYGNNYVIGDKDVQGLNETRVPNPNITWETAVTWDLGIETTMWRGLLGVEFDFFHSKRSDILWTRNVSVPRYTGLSLPNENLAEVLNKGFELILTHNHRIGEVRYSVSANVNFARNKVLYMDEAPLAEKYQMGTGRPMHTSLYYKAIGIFRTQEELDKYPHLSETGIGDIMFEDVNKDGVIDSKDRIRTDYTNLPEITYALNMSLAYKNFDLSVLFQGQENAQQYFGGVAYGFFGAMDYMSGNFLRWRADGRWIPGADNSNATMPKARSGWTNVNIANANTLWLVDAGFLRLKNIEIGYNLPQSFSKKIGIQNIRFSAAASNLCLIYDSMKKLGFDPETVDIWYYQPQRTFSFGINLTF